MPKRPPPPFVATYFKRVGRTSASGMCMSATKPIAPLLVKAPKNSGVEPRPSGAARTGRRRPRRVVSSVLKNIARLLPMRLLLRRRRASGVRHQGLATGPTVLGAEIAVCLSGCSEDIDGQRGLTIE